MKVTDIAERYPELLDVFEHFGFKELHNPLLRRTLARRVTVRMACDLKHVREEELLEALNRDPGGPAGKAAPAMPGREDPAPACSHPEGV